MSRNLEFQAALEVRVLLSLLSWHLGNTWSYHHSLLACHRDLKVQEVQGAQVDLVDQDIRILIQCLGLLSLLWRRSDRVDPVYPGAQSPPSGLEAHMDLEVLLGLEVHFHLAVPQDHRGTEVSHQTLR